MSITFDDSLFAGGKGPMRQLSIDSSQPIEHRTNMIDNLSRDYQNFIKHTILAIPQSKIKSSPVRETSCLAELIYDLIKR